MVSVSEEDLGWGQWWWDFCVHWSSFVAFSRFAIAHIDEPSACSMRFFFFVFLSSFLFMTDCATGNVPLKIYIYPFGLKHIYKWTIQYYSLLSCLSAQTLPSPSPNQRLPARSRVREMAAYIGRSIYHTHTGVAAGYSVKLVRSPAPQPSCRPQRPN